MNLSHGASQRSLIGLARKHTGCFREQGKTEKFERRSRTLENFSSLQAHAEATMCFGRCSLPQDPSEALNPQIKTQERKRMFLCEAEPEPEGVKAPIRRLDPLLLIHMIW